MVQFTQLRRNYISLKRSGKGLFVVILILSVAVFLCWRFIDPDIVLGEGEQINMDEYEAFEDELSEEFPADDTSNFRIPRILHQTWKNQYIPAQFQDNIRSFITHNPSFTYYFWTDESARNLIEYRHPYLLETFDNYIEPVRRADMIRYVVLYEFGGVYADLDTKCLRPLERILKKYACVVTPEPYEHASLIYGAELIVTNSIMFCRAEHPFMKSLLLNLPSFSHFSQDIDASGPNYMTFYYNKYKKFLIDRRQLDVTDNEYIYLANSQYFQNDLDHIRFDQFRRTCRKFSSLTRIQQRGCVALKRRGFARKDTKYTFTKHSFYHTGYKIVPESDKLILDLVPHAEVYNTEL